MNEAEWQELATWAEFKIGEEQDANSAHSQYVDGFDDGAWAVLQRIRSHFLWKRVVK